MGVNISYSVAWDSLLMEKTRVLLASKLVSPGTHLHALLVGSTNVEIIGEGASGPEVLTCAREVKPHVLIIDVYPKDRELLAGIQSLRKDLPGIKVVVLSTAADKEFVLRLLRAGVQSYLLERDIERHLVSAVRAVAGGHVFLCPYACGALLAGYRKRSRARKKKRPLPAPNGELPHVRDAA